MGAVVTIEGQAAAGSVTDSDGQYTISRLAAGTYKLVVKYIGYKTATASITATDKKGVYTLDVTMSADQQALGEVVVTGMAMKNTEEAMTEAAKNSQVVVNNVSAQEIKRTQDNNAGEVIRRIPGVNLIEDKFVMVRGLSQRYNNVWINGGAVPSSEPDSRAFSFDIIPSSQIDNMMIVKSPAAEYPADFTGGFIQVNTKDIPPQNRFSVPAGGNWNDETAFSTLKYADMSGKYVKDGPVALMGSGLNNNWRVKTKRPAGDMKLGADWNCRWLLDGMSIGVVGAVNYTNEYRAYKG